MHIFLKNTCGETNNQFYLAWKRKYYQIISHGGLSENMIHEEASTIHSNIFNGLTGQWLGEISAKISEKLWVDKIDCIKVIIFEDGQRSHKILSSFWINNKLMIVVMLLSHGVNAMC